MKILQTNSFESILINKALGSWIWDIDGKKYLDLESGMWCVNLGHNHPKIIKAMKVQIDQIIHRNKNFLTPVTIKAAENILDLFPKYLDRITFLNSGSEAMEFAINLVKKVTNRKHFISLENSYLGAFGQAKISSFTSKSRNDYKIPFPTCLNNKCSCLDKYQILIDKLFNNGHSNPAGFILEPIMVSGGIYRPCKTFVQYICEKVHDSDGLVLVDEVTTGFGRTGVMFGYELFNIQPDFIILGKALGNGYPISAVVTSSSIEERISLDNLYYVQSHQLDPLGSAVSNSVIETFQKDQIINQIQMKKKKINKILYDLEYSWINEIRSFGMIFGIEVRNLEKLPSKENINIIKNKLLQLGILIGFNLSKSIIRFLPPLVIQNEEIEFLKSALIQI